MLSKRAGTGPAAAPKSHVVNCKLDADIRKSLTGTALFQDGKMTCTLNYPGWASKRPVVTDRCVC